MGLPGPRGGDFNGGCCLPLSDTLVCQHFYRLNLLIFCFSELLSPGVKNKNFKCHRTYRLFAGK